MVDRVAAIMEAAARHPAGLTLTALAAQIDAPLSSTQGLANGLVSAGYLVERERSYVLGPAPYLLTRVAGVPPVDSVSHEDLRAIYAQTGHTVVLGIVVGGSLYYIDHVAASARFDYLAEQFVRRPLIRTSSGWILLSGMSRRDLWSHLAALPPDQEPVVNSFLDSLRTIQSDDLVVAPSAADDGADGVAVAVRAKGQVIGSVAVVGDRELIARDADAIADVLRRHRNRWNS